MSSPPSTRHDFSLSLWLYLAREPSASSSSSLHNAQLIVARSTTRARELAVALPRQARDLGIRLTEVRPLDDSLESLFRELVR